MDDSFGLYFVSVLSRLMIGDYTGNLCGVLCILFTFFFITYILKRYFRSFCCELCIIKFILIYRYYNKNYKIYAYSNGNNYSFFRLLGILCFDIIPHHEDSLNQICSFINKNLWYFCNQSFEIFSFFCE